MIDVITWPDGWRAAYQPSVFKFSFGVNQGSYSITSVGGKANIVAGAGVVNFGLTNYIRFFNGSEIVIGQVTEIVGTDVRTDIPLAAGLSSRPVYRLFEQPMKIRIETARLSKGEGFKIFGMFYAIFKDGYYSFDMQGYIQKAFSNIGLPPDQEVSTNDSELYIQYRLFLLYDDLEIKVKDVFSVLYGTQESISPGQPLRIGALEKFNGKPGIVSEVVGNKVITFLA